MRCLVEDFDLYSFPALTMLWILGICDIQVEMENLKKVIVCKYIELFLKLLVLIWSLILPDVARANSMASY